MRNEEPLTEWGYLRDIKLSPTEIAQAQKRVLSSLDKLAHILDNPPPKKTKFYDAGITIWSAVPLPDSDLIRAQELYLRVFATSGAGKTHVEEGLLSIIAASENRDSMQFWLDALELSRPRDSFSNRRRTLVLAALARMAISRNEPEAYKVLIDLTHHNKPEIRVLAIYYLGRSYLDVERTIPDQVVNRLSESAVKDISFEARFFARRILESIGREIQIDNPKGAYSFKVYLRGLKSVYRTIELRSEDTLEDLHLAIQDAFEWDNDHLYSFFMNGELYDDRFRFQCPLELTMPSPFEEETFPSTYETVIGKLGLTLKHTFLYFFDYGDSHQFNVEVVDIRSNAGPGKYPRVVDQKGEVPEQYPSYDDDDDW